MKRFDSLQVPLSGVNLIEASAGTGKTYTITSLYVRLLLEKELLPEQILVVTFTEAATKEIKERVRARLQTVLYVMRGEREVGTDDFLAGLVNKYEGDEKVVAILVNAIRSLDLAAIYTIHGFCKRLLSDCAFESGVDFETEFISDNTALLQEIVDDFWRIESPGWGRILIGYLYAKGYSSDSLLNELQKVVMRIINFGRGILLLPPVRGTIDPEEVVSQLAELWTGEREEIVAVLNSGALSQARDNYCEANLTAWSAELDAYFRDSKQVVFPANVFQKFSAETLAAHTKKNKTTPGHRFFDLAGTLIQGLKQAYADIRLACTEYCCKELPERKRKHSIMTYEDLLLGVRNGLKSPGSGTVMAEQVRNRYPAALIDEFQDTDPLQFEIFERLYRDTSYCLFLIGDPKQAIYSFRGADVFAYLQAAATTVDQYTLTTNFRSEPPLIKAVNSLFGRHDNPFVLEEIKYRPVRAAENPVAPLNITDDDDKPLTIWPFEPQARLSDAKNLVVRGVADKIVQLINLGRQGNARLGHKPLTAGDMAVLVRTHHEGELVRNALYNKGVPAVIHSRESIYSSAEARDLQFLLAGISNPLDKKKLHAALATGLLGYRDEDFYNLEENESAWEAILDRFVDYYQQWSEHGFAVMFGSLLKLEGVNERIAGNVNAERCLTNLRHLVDLLQAAVHAEGLGPVELLGWLKAKRQGVSNIEDEEQLRLESDENLVSIVTIHKSKGLEYPVVFCPFLWDTRYGKPIKSFYAAFHDDAKKLCIDLGTIDLQQHHNLQQREILAEELRLLYVAVTRARNRCYLSWGRAEAKRNPVSERSALGYLLHSFVAEGGTGKTGEQEPTKIREGGHYDGVLGGLADAVPEAVGIEPLPDSSRLSDINDFEQRVFGHSRTFNRDLAASGTIQSFSAMQNRADIEEPDYDAETVFILPQRPMITEEEGGERSLLSFPRGRRAGSCLHAILEHLDFSAPAGKNNLDMVTGWLRRFGFGDGWAVPVLEGLADVCRTPLQYGDETFCLGDLSKAHRLDELEFYYPVPMLSTEKLRAIFAAHLENSFAGSSSKRLSGQARQGNSFMKGFIDLVFEWQGRLFIVDYKSNYLGNRVDDYGPTVLAKAIAESSYDLQYYIYTLTLHRYLMKRLQDNYNYDRYFGGVFYLFIRGMKPERGPKSGVYFDRPSKERIEALDRWLIPGQLQAGYD